ncbi:MAG: hypothetical protein NUV44_00175, partial [Candidatus Scalindua sp.]|nr:hypothetical protein [Candidatus Scalindua sp.]
IIRSKKEQPNPPINPLVEKEEEEKSGGFGQKIISTIHHELSQCHWIGQGSLTWKFIYIQTRFFIFILVAFITFDILQKTLTAGSITIFLYLKVGLPAILCD